MTTTLREWVDRYSDNFVQDDNSNGLLVVDGFDDCILGVCRRFDDVFVVYDRAKVIAKLQANGMGEEDAQEEFNQLGVWMGEHTPGFVELPPRE